MPEVNGAVHQRNGLVSLMQGEGGMRELILMLDVFTDKNGGLCVCVY